MTDRYVARYRGEWIVVFDLDTGKMVDRFYGWDAGWPEASALLDRLNGK